MGNLKHVEHVAIAPKTTTFKRLKKYYGVRLAQHAAEMIPCLVNKTGHTDTYCDNKLCEALRRRFGTDGTKDVFV